LLAAMIGCIVIAMRPAPKGTIVQRQAAPIGSNGAANKPVTETNELVTEDKP
jgi:NADH-quinone oxidoreductase subunit J